MLGASARYSRLRVPVETGTPPYRRRKVHFAPDALAGIRRSIPLRLLFLADPLALGSARTDWGLSAKSILLRTPWRASVAPFPCGSSSSRTRWRWAPLGWLRSLGKEARRPVGPCPRGRRGGYHTFSGAG